MKKKLLLFRLFALVAALTCALGAAAYSFYTGGYYYNITSTANKTVEVTYKDTNYSSYSGSKTIPSTVTYNGTTYTVTAIGESAFRNSTDLSRVKIPYTVTTIGNDAFNGCRMMESITIGSGVTRIGSYAFMGCMNLNPVTCQATTPPTIQSNTFSSYAYLATLVVPKGRTSAYQAADYWQNFSTIEELPYDFVSNGIFYSITSTGTVDVTHGGGTNSYQGSVSIPTRVSNGGQTYYVTGIGEEAFLYCTSLTSVTIPITVTTIRNNAFRNCTALPSITIPNSVTTIGLQAFSNCNALTSVTIPNSVTTIGNSAFSSCTSLAEVTIGYGVTSIDEYAFYYNNALLNVTCWATTPPTIKNTSFHYVTLDDGVLTVPRGCGDAYRSANWWKNFNTINELDYSFVVSDIYYNVTGTNTVEVTYKDTNYNSYSGDVSIPNTVTYGGKTYSVKGIGYRAFFGCRDLTSVTISAALTSIGDYAFYYCDKLTSVNVPSSVTSIGRDAFYYCSKLASITIPVGVSVIRDYTFCNCSSLTTVVIPSSVTTIERYAFAVCSGLTSVTIPNSVTSIGEYAFESCESMTSVAIPASVTSIGDYAFMCHNLADVTCMAITPPTMSAKTVFGNTTYSNAVLSVPRGGISSYQTTNWWCDFSHIQDLGYSFKKNGIYYNITGSNTVEVTYKDEEYASYSGSVTIPSAVSYGAYTYRVTAIGKGAFMGCYDLTSVTIPSSVISIGESAFQGCFPLPSVTFPNSLTTIGEWAFYGCDSLVSVTIPSSVTSIASTAFNYCNALVSMTVASGNPVYDSRDNCNAIIDTERDLVVCGCINTVIPNTVVGIYPYAFGFSVSMSHFTIPNSVTDVYYCAFILSGLERVIIGSSVDYIGSQAFWGCSHLEDITCLATTPPWIDDNTFGSDNYEYSKLRVPASSLNAYKTANHWKNFMHIVAITQGDIDGDGNISIADVADLIDLILSGEASIEVYPTADVDGDGRITIADASDLIDHIISGT